MRTHGKVDLNQANIVRALRKVGCSVQSLSSVGNGCPDLLVAFQMRWFLLEVKSAKGKLTSQQQDWNHRMCGPVYIVRDVAEALLVLGFELPESRQVEEIQRLKR